MRRLLLVCCVALQMLSVYADELDDLFAVEDDFSGSESESESEGTEESEPNVGSGSDSYVDLDALGTRDPKFTGRVKLEGGLLYGLDDWPGRDAAADTEIADLYSGTIFYEMATRFSLDVRPASHIRFFGSATIELNTDRMVFAPYSIGELFVDYTLAETWFFRVGKQRMTWGQGRLLGNPGNVVSGIDDGVAVRGFVPLGPNGITAAVFARGSDFKDTSNPDHREFTYAALYDTTIRNITVGSSLRYRHADDVRPLHAAAYVKTSVGPLDVSLEGVRHFDPHNFGHEAYQWIVSNVFWEFGDPLWRVIAEYQFGDTDTAQTTGQQSAVAVRAPRVLGWTPAVQWKHSYTETAGEIVAGIDRSLAAHLRTSIGIPITYGSPDSYYRTASDVPGNRVAAVILRLGVTLNY